MGQFFKLDADLSRRRDLTPASKLVCAVLRSHVAYKPGAPVGWEWLQDVTGLAGAECQEAIRDLLARDMLPADPVDRPALVAGVYPRDVDPCAAAAVAPPERGSLCFPTKLLHFDLSNDARVVAAYLMTLARREGCAWPSLQTIASTCRLTMDEADWAVSCLEGAGLVTRGTGYPSRAEGNFVLREKSHLQTYWPTQRAWRLLAKD